MGNVRVVFKEDKSITIIYPIPKSKLSEKEIFDKAMSGELKGLPYKDMDASKLPSRENRDCWERDGAKKSIKVNIVKAKKIKEEKKRAELIVKEKDNILEKQAVANLKAKGEIK